MSQILQRLVGGFAGAFNFLTNIKSRPSDDELTAHYKRLQRSCVLATLLPLAIFVGSLVVANALDRLEASLWRGVALTELRTLAFTVVMTVFVASIVYAVFSYWRLWRFCRAEGVL